MEIQNLNLLCNLLKTFEFYLNKNRWQMQWPLLLDKYNIKIWNSYRYVII